MRCNSTIHWTLENGKNILSISITVMDNKFKDYKFNMNESMLMSDGKSFIFKRDIV